ncbi:hypothetical protein [Aureimonas sp. N4]|uniref:hypothetical protein n=1 Tax=Aureimonas sp. N4 TaxID=1638165 RepID=UPI000784974D|nr:hypothetical protein [Aureimonas sp. N4]
MAHAAAVAALGIGVLSLGAAPGHARNIRVGAWHLGTYKGSLPAQCIAVNPSDEHGAMLVAYVVPFGVIRFAYAKDGMPWRQGQQVEVEVLVDGQPVGLGSTEALDATSVTMVSKVAGRQAGSLLAAVENGQRAVVQTGDVRSTFTLAGTKRATDLLSQCDMNKGQLPAYVTGDSDGTSDKGSASNLNRSTAADEEEAALEAEGDMAEAAAAARNRQQASGGSGGDTRGDADALGRALDGMTGGGSSPVAQFRCILSGAEVTGLPPAVIGSKTGQMTITMLTDGGAQVNGETLKPIRTKGGASGLASAVYSAQDVLRASMGRQGERAPVMGLSEQQTDAFNFMMGWARDVTVQTMGDKPRYMLLAPDSDTVAFFDLDRNGQPVNQTTSDCVRTR